jgi:hypothetical protein
MSALDLCRGIGTVTMIFWKQVPLTEEVNTARIEGFHAIKELRSCRAHSTTDIRDSDSTCTREAA